MMEPRSVFAGMMGRAIGSANEVGTEIVIWIGGIGPLIAIPESVKGLAHAVRIDMNPGDALIA